MAKMTYKIFLKNLVEDIDKNRDKICSTHNNFGSVFPFNTTNSRFTKLKFCYHSCKKFTCFVHYYCYGKDSFEVIIDNNTKVDYNRWHYDDFEVLDYDEGYVVFKQKDITDNELFMETL